MRIIDGIKTKGPKVLLKGCSRQDLPQFFVDMGYKVGAEIGVFKGEYTEALGKAGLKIYAIDPWSVYPDFPHPQGQKRLDFLYEHTLRVVEPYNIHVIRKDSMAASEDFEDESLDFVYIDGNHAFRYVADDIFEWSKKVRKGGVVSGHDYAQGLNMHWQKMHVRYVVNAYIASFKIQNWYLTDLIPGLSGDQKTRSWFWIKE